MRRPVIAGNWKMNNLISDTCLMLEKLIPLVKNNHDVDVIIAPTFISLVAAKKTLSSTNIKLAAQNCYFENSGAYTGEISPAMLKDIGCEYVILGHSERRQYFNETDEIINKKIRKALEFGLSVIFCIGETLNEREKDETFTVIEKQLFSGLNEVSDLSKLILAYEPVWAIGTGKTATDDQAEEVHAFIRSLIGKKYGTTSAEKIIIQYGGSVKPENIKGLMSREHIDGALVGGASLKAESFASLVNFTGK